MSGSIKAESGEVRAQDLGEADRHGVAAGMTGVEPHPAGGSGPAREKSSGRLRARVVSAVAMISVAVAAIWAGGTVFTLLVVAISAIMAWEWGRMVRGTVADPVLTIHAICQLLACLATLWGAPSLGVLILAFGAIAAASLARDLQPALSAAGVAIIGGAALALVWLRCDPAAGTAAVLFVMICVWATDTFAMIAGKSIGGPQLAPRISPQKTWAGAIGGFVAAALVGALIAPWLAGGDALTALIVAGALSVAAQVGDLSESAVKRAFGVKNSSELIPGHGGVLDRMDGLVGAALLAAALSLFLDPQAPGLALLGVR